MLKRSDLSLRFKTLTESQARMSNGRLFQFIAAECLKQRDDETVRMYLTDSRMSADYDWDYE